MLNQASDANPQSDIPTLVKQRENFGQDKAYESLFAIR